MFKNILFALYTGIAFYASTPTLTLEKNIVPKALQIVSNHKIKLLIFSGILLSYNLYKYIISVHEKKEKKELSIKVLLDDKESVKYLLDKYNYHNPEKTLTY